MDSVVNCRKVGTKNDEKDGKADPYQFVRAVDVGNIGLGLFSVWLDVLPLPQQRLPALNSRTSRLSRLPKAFDRS
jgi:hypothetical protein